MKNKRRNHSAQFKAKVALAAAKGDKTIAELALDLTTVIPCWGDGVSVLNFQDRLDNLM